MSCYFRHLNEIFKEAGIEVDKHRRKLVDVKIHEIVGIPYKHCPEAWRRVKAWLADEEKRQKLVEALRKSMV